MINSVTLSALRAKVQPEITEPKIANDALDSASIETAAPAIFALTYPHPAPNTKLPVIVPTRINLSPDDGLSSSGDPASIMVHIIDHLTIKCNMPALTCKEVMLCL